MTTWLVFQTEKQAQAYADACWIHYLKLAPSEQASDKQPIEKYPASVDQTRAELEAAADPDAVKQDLSVVFLRGLDSHGQPTDQGRSTAWAVPMLTAKGGWAVQCPPFDDVGGPEPVWPDPAPLPSDTPALPLGLMSRSLQAVRPRKPRFARTRRILRAMRTPFMRRKQMAPDKTVEAFADAPAEEPAYELPPSQFEIPNTQALTNDLVRRLEHPDEFTDDEAA